MIDVDTLDWIGTLALLAGVLIRLATWRKYVDAFAATYGSAPPRSWLLRRDPNPQVERTRVPLALGTMVALAGFSIFLIGLLSS